MSPAKAVVIVLRDADRLLVIQRAAGRPRGGHWMPPSGRVEVGESLAETVVREAREELGIDVRALREAWQSPTDDGRYRLHWWLAEPVGSPSKAFDAIQPDPAEIQALRWVTADQYLALRPGFPEHAGFFSEVWPGVLGDHTGSTPTC